ncbi:MAG: putative DNA binding domain-containing protein [Nitrospirae bacterium]|nr:putative DNA binding domain-containing protein [Nitrospirota bacterium]
MTTEELEALLADLESDRVERKRSGADRSSIRKGICAFANDLAGSGKAGVIFVGVEDKGHCAELPITDELLRTLAQMRSDGNILPPPSMAVQKRVINGCEAAVVVVEPSRETPVRYQGRVWVKVGPTLQVALPEEERRLAERRRAADLPFDLRVVPDAALADLDTDFFRREYLPRAVAPDVLEQNRRTLEQQLASLRFLTGSRPNYGAILIIGKDPQRWVPGAYVQFLRVDGGKLTDPIRDQKQISGPLSQVSSRLDEIFEINISTATDVRAGARDVRRPDYPVVALQQLVRNALIHRSYEGTNAPVRVYWFSDRVEIQSPGGLYGQVNPGNFGKGATDYRNPLIAEALFHLGYVQKFGLGIPLAQEELTKNGNPPPDFLFEPNAVLVIVEPAR